jgi:hypothetical protein
LFHAATLAWFCSAVDSSLNRSTNDSWDLLT